MIIPSATYRIQFRNGMTFDRVAALAPYLSRLGVTHLYASPIFAAVPGSTHGYDAIDFSTIEPSLGGESAFRAMAEVLREHDIAILLDFVPNHMGANPLNAWWHDVLEWGAAADHAQHFDIDWSAPKLIVPVLLVPYGVALERGDFALSVEPDDGTFSFTANGLKLPLTPPSYAHVLSRVREDVFADLARQFAVATSETAAALKAELSLLATDHREALEGELRSISKDRHAVHALHELQVWRLAYWRSARETLTYRRFFEIADLVGVNVGRPSVFDDAHAKVFELMRDSAIEAVRLDHIDGLADPSEYLHRLAGELEAPYVLVEKILGKAEEVRSDWPVAGTTGYEFIAALSWALVDWRGLPLLTESYNTFVGSATPFSEIAATTKRRILSRNFAGELERLKDLARAIAERHLETRDLGADTLRRAIIELIAALDVYRTYVAITGPSDEDRKILAAAAEAAKQTREIEDEEAIDFLVRVIELDFAAPEDQAAAYEFTSRFQQTTGPIMAKAIEDTAFYQFNALIALNEVGGHPDDHGRFPRDFHLAMERRSQIQPAGLSATSTHDTKRGEDGRARLYALSEMPEAWASAVDHWTSLLEHDGDRGIDPNSEWLFYQALLAAWPLDLRPGDPAGLAQLSQRMAEFMLKATREAKTHTSWTGPDPAYEEALKNFVAAALDPERSSRFLTHFHELCQPVFVAGALNSLSQILIKATAPGVPDIYQGTEFWDTSLVDPDNRRPIDFEVIAARALSLQRLALPELLSSWRDGAAKFRLLQAALDFRRGRRSLFETGAYLPLEVAGKRAQHILAFARMRADQACIVVTPRAALKLLEGATIPLISPSRWGDTEIRLPEQLIDHAAVDILTGRNFRTGARLAVSDLLSTFPVALLGRP